MTTLPNGNRKIAASGSVELWEVTPDYYNSFNAKPVHEVYDKGRSLPPGTTKVWFLAASMSEHLIPDGTLEREHDWNWSFYAKRGSDLIRLLGKATPSAAVLQKLAVESGTLNSPNLGRDRGTPKLVLYNGVVRKTKDVLNDFELGPLGDVKVWKIPRKLQWAVGKDFEYYVEKDFKWDARYILETQVAGIITVYTLQNHIVHLQYNHDKPATVGPAVRALAERENFSIDVELPEPKTGKKRTIQPNSNMHQMLRYVSENPGSSRSDWYAKHLGLSAQGMPGWTSDKSPDGVAASMGWIENQGTSGQYKLSVTMLGHMILGILDNGKPLSYTPTF